MPSLSIILGRFLFLAFVATATLGAHAYAQEQNLPPLPQDRTAAVIFVYQMIGEDLYPPASIKSEQFESHLGELQAGRYNILPLPDIVQTLSAENPDPLPPRTVALTFDGGHISVLDRAVPLLLKYNYPFTLFVSPENMDRKDSQYVGWDDLKKLARNKLVTIGLHPANYADISALPPEEIKRQVNNARARLREETGIEARLFAYPFGQYSKAYRDIIAVGGFDAAFGQQSSVVYNGSDLFSLPRFTMNEAFGDGERFVMTANALPLPASDIQPDNQTPDSKKPVIGFTVDPLLVPQLNQISCFISGQEQPDTQIVGKNRVEIRPRKEFDEERTRINCTMPGPAYEPENQARWRWFGMLLTTKIPEN